MKQALQFAGFEIYRRDVRAFVLIAERAAERQVFWTGRPRVLYRRH
jgi:hypothetical protein